MFKKFISTMLVFILFIGSSGTFSGCSSKDNTGVRDVFKIIGGALSNEALKNSFAGLLKAFQKDPNSDTARQILLFWDLAGEFLRQIGMTLSDSQIDELKKALDDNGTAPEGLLAIAQTQFKLVSDNVRATEYVTKNELQKLVKEAQIKNYDAVQNAVKARNAATAAASDLADKNALKAIDYIQRLHNGTVKKDSLEFDLMASLCVQYLTAWGNMSEGIKGKAANAALTLASMLEKDAISINELQTSIDNSHAVSPETSMAISTLLNN